MMLNFCPLLIKIRSFKNREHFNEKKDGPYRSFGYLSLFSWQNGAKEKYSNFAIFNRISDTKTRVLSKQSQIY